MHNKRRALLAAILVAIPSPFILGFLLQAYSPELFYFRTAGDANTVTSDVMTLLGSSSGYLAYLSAFLLFFIVGFVAAVVATSGSRTAPTATPARTEARPEARPAPTQARAVPREGETEEGVVKWFNVKKGFGFITRDSGDDIFVHFRAIEGQGRRVLRQGQRVSYVVMEADKGLQADQVEILSED